MIKSLFEEFVKYYFMINPISLNSDNTSTEKNIKNNIEKCFNKFLKENHLMKENLIISFLPFDCDKKIDTKLLYNILSFDDLEKRNSKIILCISNKKRQTKNITIKVSDKVLIKFEIVDINKDKIIEFLNKHCKNNNKEISN